MGRTVTSIVSHRTGRRNPAPALFLVALAIPRFAGAGASDPPNAASAAAKGELTASYMDRSFGFSIDYPAGSVVVREKSFVGTNEVELARFVQEQHIWSLAVHLTTADRRTDPETLLASIRETLASTDSKLKEIRAKVFPAGHQPLVDFAAVVSSGNKKWLRQQAVIRNDANAYYTLIFITPEADRNIATTTFAKIVRSFQLLRSEQTQQQIDEALKKGTALLLAAASNPEKIAPAEPVETYFRVLENGTEVGFVRLYESMLELQGHHGVGIEQISWSFRPDGTVVHSVKTMFLADTLKFGKWNNSLRILRPGPEGKPPVVSLAIETGLRQDDKLLIAYSPRFNASTMKDKVLQLEPNFGGPAWFILLPRFVDLSKPELYAFSAYDSERHGLCLQTIEVIGPTRAMIDGQSRSAVRLRGSEGLMPPYDEILVDRAGHLLKAIRGQTEMILTTKDYVDRTYKPRVEQNLALFKKHPCPIPAPPDH